MLEGGCHCGAIRYTAGGEPFHQTVCYCVDCRRSSGAVSVAWFSVQRRDFRWVGTPAAYRSSRHGTRRFCSNCGTSLTFENDTLPDELDIAIATLDEPDLVQPQNRTFVSQRPSWEELAGSLPRFEQSRRDG